MSIIEKAVDKLGPGKGASQRQDSVKPGFGHGDLERTPSPPSLEVAQDGRTHKVDQAPLLQGGRKSELPVVRLDYEFLRESGILTPDDERSKLAEEYRMIKRPLLLNIDHKGADVVENANLIMVASALSGEGKTFTSINLAMSIAMEQDRTVLLVDADVAKPSAAQFLGINTEKGLVDLLRNPAMTIADVIVQTDIPNLRVVSAGIPHGRSTELLASDRMRVIMQELSQRYNDRVVIFDSPPLLQTSQASVLANMMGQIVHVVAAGRTDQHAVTYALSRISKQKIVGMLLNNYNPMAGSRMGGTYGHGYGYGYGYGYGQHRK